MDLKKEVFTTFEAADLCNANVSSIKNWIEKGELEAFRTPGGHYRIRNASLSEFLDKHGMPNPLAALEPKIVAALLEQPLADLLSEALGPLEFHSSEHILDALVLLGEHLPKWILLDERSLAPLDVEEVIGAIKRNPSLSDAHILLITDQPTELERATLVPRGGSPRETTARLLERIIVDD